MGLGFGRADPVAALDTTAELRVDADGAQGEKVGLDGHHRGLLGLEGRHRGSGDGRGSEGCGDGMGSEGCGDGRGSRSLSTFCIAGGFFFGLSSGASCSRTLSVATARRTFIRALLVAAMAIGGTPEAADFPR